MKPRQITGHRKIYASVWIVLASLVPATCPAGTEDDSFDRFTVSLGGYHVLRYNSFALLTNRPSGVGVGINPEETLGLDAKQTVFRADLRYRFNPRHALTFSWFDINANNGLTIETELEWVDENGDPITIPVGASVSSSLNYEIWKLGYLWTFYDSDKVRISAGAGLHTTSVSLSLDADTTSSGASASRGDTTLPLPVLSFEMAYLIQPRLQWFARAELFAISVGDWSGTYDDIVLGIEYRLLDNLSIGTAIGNNSLSAKEKKSGSLFEYENRITGALFYLQGNF